MADNSELKPEQPPVEGGAEGEQGPSKKALKKAEAKAKKEAEKAKRAAELEAQRAASAAKEAADDKAKDNYGDRDVVKLESAKVALKQYGDEHLGKTVKLRAWIQQSRMQGAKMCFVELREVEDWSIQGVIAANNEGEPVSKQMVKWVGAVSLESYVAVEGTVAKPLEPVKSCKVSNYELHITKMYCIARGPEMLGLTLGASNAAISSFEVDGQMQQLSISDNGPGLSATLETHLDNIVMHKRAPLQQAIQTVRENVRDLFVEYLKKNEFHSFEPPCLIGAASEGGANVFGLPYFGKNAFLAQSPQFYKQLEIAGGRKRVYCVGPVFRAENSNTPRHMTEFTGLDMEMEIEENYREVIYMLEGLFLYIFRNLEERCKEQIALVRTIYPSEPFTLPEDGKEVRLTFAEGQKLLREEGPEEFRNVTDDEDMSTPQEKALGAIIRKKYGTDFYVLDKFPESARPFYAKEDPENPKVTNAYDFFMRGQEIMSGGQRINNPAELEARMRTKGVDPNSSGLKEYVNFFKQAGCPPHGGGGIGLDRVVAFFLNLPNVQLAAYYPRTPSRLTP
ncbi:hypothetical protein VSDG_05553 [Cytospora chrysosperma]|uniref:Probable aspartate--tRNA ligase, cytoplasmic n=1 Tax=Cytospora chrysosperma TaxID=252740 RepID=A0A423W069_CYTCH|nr:hypothetical protein VSDG_05553 [Valsa sordida]